MSKELEVDILTQDILSKLAEDSNEIKPGSTISRSTKIKRTTGQLASVEARKRNDPLYQRMVKYRELYFKYRTLLHQKYTPRVRSQARR